MKKKKKQKKHIRTSKKGKKYCAGTGPDKDKIHDMGVKITHDVPVDEGFSNAFEKRRSEMK
jgi:hypothetical protein